MKIKPLRIILCLLFFGMLSYSGKIFSQEEPQTIKIQKQESFIKAQFDETNYKVIAMDRYGNPHEEAIKEYVITYSENGQIFEARVIGHTFPEKTIQYLTKKRQTAVKICIIKIIAEDKDGHLQKLPDLCDIVIFPDCKKVNKKKKH